MNLINLCSFDSFYGLSVWWICCFLGLVSGRRAIAWRFRVRDEICVVWVVLDYVLMFCVCCLLVWICVWCLCWLLGLMLMFWWCCRCCVFGKSCFGWIFFGCCWVVVDVLWMCWCVWGWWCWLCVCCWWLLLVLGGLWCVCEMMMMMIVVFEFSLLVIKVAIYDDGNFSFGIWLNFDFWLRVCMFDYFYFCFWWFCLWVDECDVGRWFACEFWFCSGWFRDAVVWCIVLMNVWELWCGGGNCVYYILVCCLLCLCLYWCWWNGW